ncbi:MAG: hypothetical protein AAB883_00125 [Patescibacteria group bacterium]
MTNESLIHKNVMRRVRTIHALRPFASTTALSVVLFLVAVWGIGREVWVARVVENMPSLADIGAVLRFVIAAFANTDIIVQSLSVLALAAFLWLIADGVRNLRLAPRLA